MPRGQTGFFDTRVKAVPIPSPAVFAQKSNIINLGGNGGDCGFRAMAATIMDNIFVRPRANEELAKNILILHAHYFPQSPKAVRLMTNTQHFSSLASSPTSRARFLTELAYVLRQAAVDEICAHPEQYRGAFADQDEGTAPKKMRQDTTWIDETAIAALSNKLKLPITVQVVELNKELPMRFCYNAEMEKPPGSPITLQLQLPQQHYLAQVNNPDNFALINPDRIEPVKPIATPPEDPELAEILAQLAEADALLLKEYDQTSDRLQFMVNNGELSKDDLIDIYIKGLNHSDYLQGRVKYVGIEHGNQHFFETLQNASNGVKPVTLPDESYEQQITNELIHAIARSISIGQLDHSVYESVESSHKM